VTDERPSASGAWRIDAAHVAKTGTRLTSFTAATRGRSKETYTVLSAKRRSPPRPTQVATTPRAARAAPPSSQAAESSVSQSRRRS